jgi:transcriptional regulator of acetoin/glycerol metabolism
MLRLREMIRKVGSSRVSVLLQGESGTGKELVARAIYAARPRGEFVPIDCGSLAPTLIESELFGHQRGAFTGAVGSRPGLLREVPLKMGFNTGIPRAPRSAAGALDPPVLKVLPGAQRGRKRAKIICLTCNFKGCVGRCRFQSARC